MMKCLQPMCDSHQVLNIFVLLAHRSLRCSCVSSLASESMCHAIHMFDSMSRSSMPQLSSGSARRRLSKMRCHASSISAADLSRRGCNFSCCRVKNFIIHKCNYLLSSSVQAPTLDDMIGDHAHMYSFSIGSRVLTSGSKIALLANSTPIAANSLKGSNVASCYSSACSEAPSISVVIFVLRSLSSSS